MTESGAKLFARLDGHKSVHDIEPRLFPQNTQSGPGALVELYGMEGTGKTELLYHFLCRAILPDDAGGLQLDVLFIDTDYSLDMLRLVSILDARLAGAAGSSSSPRQQEARVRACISRLLVAHCSSSWQLLVTLHTLEARLASQPSLALVLLDSASAFYWPDRGGGGASVAKQEENLSKCSQLLAALLRDYQISIFASCHANRRHCSHASSSSHSHLCRPWQQLITHRLLCSRQEVALTEGSEERPKGHIFSVHCTSTSSGSKAYRNGSFRVGDGGLEFV
ncbi:DNA repair protein XRCC2 [Vanacampus margaritifer]